MYFVYVLKLSDNTYYKGLTNNLANRLTQHEKRGINFTKRKLPFKLVHVEVCKDRVMARKMELFFKSGYGREIIKEINCD